MQDGKKEIDTSTATKRNCRIRRNYPNVSYLCSKNCIFDSFFLFDRNRYTGSDQSGVFLLWEKAEQIDTNKCEDIKYYLAAIAKHEVINERNKFVRMLNWMKM